MATPILNINELADGQADAFATVNAALRALEASTNAALSVDLTSDDYSLSAEEFTRNGLFMTTGNAVARILTVPQSVRLFIVQNSGSSSLDVARGSTTVSVAAGKSRHLFTDGTANGLMVLDFT